MFKCIVSSGCSYAYGYGLEHRNRRYAQIIANLFGAELFDVSMAGISNDTIASFTIVGINKALKKYRPEEVLVIVGWTTTARVELWDTTNNKIAAAFVAGTSAGRRKENSYLQVADEFYDKHTYQPCYGFYRLLNAFNYVETVCELNKVKNVHCHNLRCVPANFGPYNWYYTELKTNEILKENVSPSTRLKLDQLCNEESFFDLCHRKKLFNTPISKHHPNDVGHEIWSEGILKKI